MNKIIIEEKIKTKSDDNIIFLTIDWKNIKEEKNALAPKWFIECVD